MGINAKLTELVATGDHGTVEAVILESGVCPAVQFMTDDLASVCEGAKDDDEKGALARFVKLFQEWANCGQVSPKRLKREMDKLFAFRHEIRNRQIRFPCFQDGKKMILTHGFFKQGSGGGLGKWPSGEVRRANTIRAEYFARKLKSGVTPKGRS